jgi:predicted GNAT superfamily acetyltransferase
MISIVPREFFCPYHKLFGQSYVDRILVLDTAKGRGRDRVDAARNGGARGLCRER